MPALVRIRRTVGRLRSDALPFLQQFGEIGVVGALVTLCIQLHHHVSLSGGNGVVRTAASVAVGQGGSAILAIGRQHAAGMALAHAKQFGSLDDGYLEFQNGVQHGKSGLFFLVQRNILHQKDIFADQLADDRIVEQRQPRGTAFLRPCILAHG